MKKIIVIAVCVVLLRIGYGVYLGIEPRVDESIVYDIYSLLKENGYNAERDLYKTGFGLSSIKICSIDAIIPEGFELDQLAYHPEYFTINVFLYQSENDAIIKTGQFSPRGDIYLDDYGKYNRFGFFAAVHYFQEGNAIIMYQGVDPVLHKLLESYCGKQFAGD